jgi:hypothetical protein
LPSHNNIGHSVDVKSIQKFLGSRDYYSSFFAMKLLALGSAFTKYCLLWQIAFLSFSTPALAALQSFKTPKDQVVVTGLQPKKKYEVKYRNAAGREGRRKVEANSCGIAVLAKAAGFQSLSIEGQQIQPATLETKTHNRCKPVKKAAGRAGLQPTRPQPAEPNAPH